ncbi:MAG TPA: TolC family protein [Candidatus Acidoferrales bacterium]|nr:TolC family protein [Candidatus Acidoferrales bacterium]
MTLPQAVEAALGNYPSIRVSEEQINAAAAGIQLARTAYLPRVDATAQLNRATRNNVFGMLLPQSVIPSISGPVLGTNNLGTAWGSAIGTLVSWEPFDFGLRRAAVAAAAGSKAQSEAALQRTRFEVVLATADAYLTLAAAQETVRASQAGVDSGEVVLKTIRALVEAQLRPGADQSRAEAELAAARTKPCPLTICSSSRRGTDHQFLWPAAWGIVKFQGPRRTTKTDGLSHVRSGSLHCAWPWLWLWLRRRGRKPSNSCRWSRARYRKPSTCRASCSRS